MTRSIWFIAVLPFFTGCLYYGYPTVTKTPELQVSNPDGSVHVYRVDVDRVERKPLTPTTQYTLSRITVDARGIIPSQLEVATTTGVLNPVGAIDGSPHEKSHYSMLIRAYRPGYRLNEVKAWEKSRELRWDAVPDLIGQEKAIDDLLAVPASGEPVKGTWWELKDDKAFGLGLQPGSVSMHQRRALEFASSEYQRLANSPIAATASMQIVRERLQQKAIWLRNFAEQ
ncbi:MAG: hypothetical protein FJ303_08980 [Planctomycetes bacterium]|nr:hypothetical protein [Planctomycetota bacterium]